MEGKYFFNNKDITMNLCIQIRDVIDIIKEREYALGGVSRIYRRSVL